MNNGTKRDYPFPNTSSTAETDWHKLIKPDDNPPPLFEERPELYPENLLKRIDALEKENENYKIILSLVFAIIQRTMGHQFEPNAWNMVWNFIQEMGLESCQFDLTGDKMSYHVINNNEEENKNDSSSND